MKVKTSDFKSALDVVKPALASKEIIEQTTSFAFMDGCVVTYNDEICIVHPTDSIELDGVIKAEELYKFLGKVRSAEFDVMVEEEEIIMKAGRSRVGFAKANDVLLPLDEDIAEKGDWQELPKMFLRACKFAAASASSDLSDQKLTCVNVKENGVLEATDNYKLLTWNLGEEMPIDTKLIPASALKQVVKLQVIEVADGDGWVHFKNEEGTIISSRVLEEDFVNTREVMDAIVDEGTKVVLPKILKEVLSTAEVFAEDKKKDGVVTLTFRNGRIVVSSENETSWFKEPIPYDGDAEFAFSITPYLLKDILDETNECTISAGALKFEGDQWQYITSLRDFKE